MSCHSTTTNGRSSFGYDETVITLTTTIDPTTIRAVYRREHSEDPKTVSYNPYLTRKYKAHIHVERTQGGNANVLRLTEQAR